MNGRRTRCIYTLHTVPRTIAELAVQYIRDEKDAIDTNIFKKWRIYDAVDFLPKNETNERPKKKLGLFNDKCETMNNDLDQFLDTTMLTSEDYKQLGCRELCNNRPMKAFHYFMKAQKQNPFHYHVYVMLTEACRIHDGLLFDSCRIAHIGQYYCDRDRTTTRRNVIL
jgi:hypothetical protein